MSGEEEDPFAVFSSGGRAPDYVKETPAPSKATESQSGELKTGMSLIVRATDNADERKSNEAKVMEPHSGITVKHPSRAFGGLQKQFAEFPYLPFSQALRQAGSSENAVDGSVVGVVVKKTDPKRNTRGGIYSTFTMWNMKGPYPGDFDQMSFLLCGKDFEKMHSQVVLGGVFTVTKFQRVKNNSGGDPPSKESCILVLNNADHLKYLGLATDLGTCSFVSRAGDKCGSYVNKKSSVYCKYHITAHRSVAKGRTQEKKVSTSIPNQGVSNRLKPTSVLPHNSRQQSFLTVSGRSGLPLQQHKDSQMSGAGFYDGVKLGSSLFISPKINVSSADKLPLAKNMGTTSQGRNALRAAAREEEKKERDSLLSSSILLSKLNTPQKRSREESSSLDSTAKLVKKQYAPIEKMPTSPFTPMRRFGATEDVVLPISSNVSENRKKNSLLVSAVAHSLEGRQTKDVKPSSLESITAISKHINSKNSGLVIEQERNEVFAKLDKQILQENAIIALSKVTMQKVSATFCTECKRYYTGKPPDSCKSSGHHLQSTTTVKRFIECLECKYKTSILGEHIHPTAIFPKCPRCRAVNKWVTGNAAPELPKH